MKNSVNVTVTLDDQFRRHSLGTDPAVVYADGRKEYFIKDVRVPDFVVTHPEKITLDDINKEVNTEVRRIMMEKYGYQKYLKNSHAKMISQDDYGRLWQVPVPADEALVMVEVINSTAEPDGTFKTYWLRVPPSTRTCQEGLAWTFGLDKDQYAPVFQS